MITIARKFRLWSIFYIIIYSGILKIIFKNIIIETIQIENSKTLVKKLLKSLRKKAIIA